MSTVAPQNSSDAVLTRRVHRILVSSGALAGTLARSSGSPDGARSRNWPGRSTT